MLARSFRLRKQEIERVYKKGRSLREGFLSMRVLANNAGHLRLAVVIPKKVAPKATQRTRLKRKTMTFMQDIIGSQKMGNNDIILSYKQLPEEKNIPPVLEKILSKVAQ